METPKEILDKGSAFEQYSHSLGILIEWKRCPNLNIVHSQSQDSHSLGILIEWKRKHLLARYQLPREFPLAGDIN
jgi:hypothetical protein